MDSQRETGALLVAASLVSAIRLRGEVIRPSPKLQEVISETIELARLVLRELHANRK